MNKFYAHILVVDDDDGIRSLLKKFLNENKYLVTTSNSAENAAEKVKLIKFDIIILDIMMKGQSGIDFTINFRNKLNTPIILLTAKGEPEERIKGLETGADDYLSKPFEPKELLLRVKNILNKTQNKETRKIKFDNIEIDLNKSKIIRDGNEFKINNSERKILDKMIGSPGETFSREDIGKLINLEKERSVDVIITRLRKKIEIDPKNPKYLQTIRGTGYVLWIE